MSDAERDGDGGVIAGLIFPEEQTEINKWRRPMSSFKNIDDLEKLLHHTAYNELRVAPEEHPVLLTEPVFPDLTAREKITQTCFENFDVQKLMFAPQEYLAALGYGLDTCVVVNCSNTSTSIVPIWKSNIMRHNAVVLPVGGQDVTRALKLMIEADESIQTYNKAFDIKEDIVDEIKIKLSYVSPEYQKELQKQPKKKEYELPDGQKITLGKALFQCTECLFEPKRFGIDSPGCVDGIILVIDSMEERHRAPLLNDECPVDIIVTGYSTMFPGFTDRTRKGLEWHFDCFHPRVTINVRAAPERKSMSWIGGSIWSSLGQKDKGCWLTKEEYDEYGPSAIHSKCM